MQQANQTTTTVIKYNDTSSISLKLPSIVVKCVDYLTDKALYLHGLFRVPGNLKRIEEIKKSIALTLDKNQYMFPANAQCHDIASILKGFFRSLDPEPLLVNKILPILLRCILSSIYFVI